MRLALCDSDAEVQGFYPDDHFAERRRGKPRGDAYFVEEEKWRLHSTRRPYKRLKKPELEEVIPGVSDPCIVAFLDYHNIGGDSWYLDYIKTRSDKQGKGHARMLFEEFFRRHSTANTIHWGKMMQPHIGHLHEKMKKKYPDISQPGSKWF